MFTASNAVAVRSTTWQGCCYCEYEDEARNANGVRVATLNAPVGLVPHAMDAVLSNTIMRPINYFDPEVDDELALGLSSLVTYPLVVVPRQLSEMDYRINYYDNIEISEKYSEDDTIMYVDYVVREPVHFISACKLGLMRLGYSKLGYSDETVRIEDSMFADVHITSTSAAYITVNGGEIAKYLYLLYQCDDNPYMCVLAKDLNISEAGVVKFPVSSFDDTLRAFVCANNNDVLDEIIITR